MKTLHFAAILALASATTFGCSGDDDDSTKGAAGATGNAGAPAAGALEIVGNYVDNFGTDQIITTKDWNGAAIVDYDNDANVVITQFPKDDMFNPNKFAKTLYTDPKNGSFYFCMVEFSLDTLADAEASKTTADASDPENGGCGGDVGGAGAGGAANNGFPWTKATKK